MAVAVGTVTSDASPKTVSGLAFAPKLVLIYSTSQVGFGSFAGDQYLYMGACITGNTQTVVEQASTWDNFIFFQPVSRSGKTDGTAINDTTLSIFVTCRATMALTSDGFTLTFSFRNANLDYNWIAIGGDDVEVALGEANAPTSPGAQSITGLSFQPTTLLLCNGFSGNSGNGTWFGHGWVDTAGRQGVTAIHDVGDGSSAIPHDTDTYQRTTKCLAVLNESTGAVDGEAEHVSYNADGFTIDWTAAPPFAAPFKWIAIGGIVSHASALTQPTSPGVQTITGLDVATELVLFQSGGGIASVSVFDAFRYMLGFGTATDQGAVWGGDDDAVASAAGRRNTRAHWNDRCIVAAHPTGTSSATVDASATLSGVDDGGFEVTWGTADAVARQVLFLAIGPAREEAEQSEAPEYDLTIGDETGLNPLLETFRIQETVDAPDTMIADIESEGSPYFRPSVGDLVFVTEDGVRIFGGYVTGLRERQFSGVATSAIVVEIQATSYELNAKRRVITASFSPGSPADTIGSAFATLVTDYYAETGVTLHPDQVDGPELPYLPFERVRGDQVNKELVDAVGYLQSIDFENRLRAWAPGDIVAPDDYDEDVNPEIFTGDIQVERQLQNGYANRVILVGEPIIIYDWVDSFVSDGVSDTFDLTHQVTGPNPYFVDGAVAFSVVDLPDTSSTESIGGLYAPGGFIWEYDPIAKTIRRRSGPLANGVNVQFRYHALFTPNATAEDAGEIAQYGLWEHVEAVPSVTTDTSAQALADAILTRKLASKDEIVTFYTRRLGYHPGQMIEIVCPSREVDGDFLITQVDTNYEADLPRLLRTVTASRSQNNDHDWRRIYQQWGE